MLVYLLIKWQISRVMVLATFLASVSPAEWSNQFFKRVSATSNDRMMRLMNGTEYLQLNTGSNPHEVFSAFSKSKSLTCAQKYLFLDLTGAQTWKPLNEFRFLIPRSQVPLQISVSCHRHTFHIVSNFLETQWKLFWV